MVRRYSLAAFGGLVVVIAGLVVFSFLTAAIPLPWSLAPDSGLRLSLSPDTLPSSGWWNLSAQFRSAEGDSWTNVVLVVWITLTLKDGAQIIETKLLGGGVGEVAIIPDLVGVVFSATYLNWSQTVTVHSSAVMPSFEGTFSLLVSATCLVLTCYFVALPIEHLSGRKRAAVLFAGVATTLPAGAYEVQTWATWNGTGWLPSAFLSVPFLVFPLASLGTALVASVSVGFAIRRSERAASASGKMPVLDSRRVG